MVLNGDIMCDLTAKFEPRTSEVWASINGPKRRRNLSHSRGIMVPNDGEIWVNLVEVMVPNDGEIQASIWPRLWPQRWPNLSLDLVEVMAPKVAKDPWTGQAYGEIWAPSIQQSNQTFCLNVKLSISTKIYQIETTKKLPKRSLTKLMTKFVTKKLWSLPAI